MSKMLTEVRLNQKTGKITVKGPGSVFNMGAILYSGEDAYIVVNDKESDIKKAKKLLISNEKKKLDKIIKQAEIRKKNLLKNKI